MLRNAVTPGQVSVRSTKPDLTPHIVGWHEEVSGELIGVKLVCVNGSIPTINELELIVRALAILSFDKVPKLMCASKVLPLGRLA